MNRNRLKVYEAVFHISTRSFKKAADLDSPISYELLLFINQVLTNRRLNSAPRLSTY